MTVYSFNIGIGWANSGVEYAQIYRALNFREIQQPAKFIFTGMTLDENIQHFTKNLGFNDEEVIWMYQYFTDIKIAPTTYTLQQVQDDIGANHLTLERNGKIGRFYFDTENTFATLYFVDESSDFVHKVEHVSQGYLIRKDYFTYTKLLSEYFAPKDNAAHLYHRRFFNENGTVAFEEIVNGHQNMYRLKQHIFYSQEELVAYFMQQLQLTEKDIILLDRETRIAQPILENKGSARVGSVVHAEHFSENSTDEHNILWNNFYEYPFQHTQYIDFFICSTQVQVDTLATQFRHYANVSPKIYAIPVGSIDTLKRPEHARKSFSLLTASRLAGEKHIDWLISAVVKAKQTLPELTFDIYGEGGERQKLVELINQLNAQDYIKLKGHQQLADVYQDYQVYISASTSEGFGLTLLEAIGSGLAMIGLDVPYGNQTFIEPNKNGYLVDKVKEDIPVIIDELAQKIVTLYTENNVNDFHEVSYQIAEPFLTKHINQRWKNLINEVTTSD